MSHLEFYLDPLARSSVLNAVSALNRFQPRTNSHPPFVRSCFSRSCSAHRLPELHLQLTEQFTEYPNISVQVSSRRRSTRRQRDRRKYSSDENSFGREVEARRWLAYPIRSVKVRPDGGKRKWRMGKRGFVRSSRCNDVGRRRRWWR